MTAQEARENLIEALDGAAGIGPKLLHEAAKAAQVTADDGEGPIWEMYAFADGLALLLFMVEGGASPEHQEQFCQDVNERIKSAYAYLSEAIGETNVHH